MPTIDKMGFVMLRRDGWDLIPVTGDQSVLAAYFFRCMDIAAFHKNTSGREPRWEILNGPLTPPGVAS